MIETYHSVVPQAVSASQLAEPPRLAGLQNDALSSHDRYSLESRLDVAIIDDRLLVRECFRRSLALIDPSLSLNCFSTIEDFVATGRMAKGRTQVAVVCIQWARSGTDQLLNRIGNVAAADPALGVIVLSDAENVGDIQKAIERGARGYIPTSIGLEVALKAMQLVAAGGTYIPVSVFSASTAGLSQKGDGVDPQDGADDVFTSRQRAVIEALRRGKANKIIAYELNMCESTVKVHVRNVMKKLNARNRTEVAYILSNRSASHVSLIGLP